MPGRHPSPDCVRECALSELVQGFSLLLLRHGIAQEQCSEVADEDRALTDRGRRRTALVCRRLVDLGCRCDQLISSPLIRARQTAELAVEAGLAPAFALSDDLRPGETPVPLLRRFAGLSAEGLPDCLGLVGHEPDLSLLAARLLGAPTASIDLRKAGVTLLELSGSPASSAQASDWVGQWPPATLKVLVPPRFLLR